MRWPAAAPGRPALALLLVLVLMVVGVAAAPPALAVEHDPTLRLYEARVIVTGTDMRSRPYGLATGLADVLVKVSGDPTILDDPRLPALQARAADDVTDYDYWDRMSGIPHHDEQGSYDRPYDLTVRFVPARIDALLTGLGRTSWPEPRPPVRLRIAVDGAAGRFPITETEPRADAMRASIHDASQRYGLIVGIPRQPDEPDPPGAAIVGGTLVLSQADLGWVGSWHLTWRGRTYDWRIVGVNFDPAFRSAVRGALQIMSGHGAPPTPQR